jgi:hypothetical protein
LSKVKKPTEFSVSGDTSPDKSRSRMSSVYYGDSDTINEEAYLEKFVFGRYKASTYSRYRVVSFFALLFVFVVSLYFIICFYNYENEAERIEMRGNLMIILGGLGILHTILLGVELLQSHKTEYQAKNMDELIEPLGRRLKKKNHPRGPSPPVSHKGDEEQGKTRNSDRITSKKKDKYSITNARKLNRMRPGKDANLNNSALGKARNFIANTYLDIIHQNSEYSIPIYHTKMEFASLGLDLIKYAFFAISYV